MKSRSIMWSAEVITFYTLLSVVGSGGPEVNTFCTLCYLKKKLGLILVPNQIGPDLENVHVKAI